jgi:hypothetical protein
MSTDEPVPVVQVERRKKPPKQQLPRTSLFTAVLLVGIVTIMSILCTTLIVLRGGEAPEGLVATSGVGLGSLGTFLARGQGST